MLTAAVIPDSIGVNQTELISQEKNDQLSMDSEDSLQDGYGLLLMMRRHFQGQCLASSSSPQQVSLPFA